MPDEFVLSIVSGEADLFNPAVTGQFAEAMAHVAALPQTPPWCGYVGRRNGTPVGFGGFKGGLDADEAVEIGYLTFPLYERTGVAKAVASGMITIAKQNNAKAVIAHTLCEENASTGVLRTNGFVRDGEGFDAEVGVVWRWRRDL